MKIDLESYESSLDVFKLGIWKVADSIARRESGLSVEIPDVYWAGKQSISEEIVRLSVVNQVLTKKTVSFAWSRRAIKMKSVDSSKSRR